MLAGAQYLDMIWYRVSVDHIWDYVQPVLVAIHELIDNVRLPYDAPSIDALAAEWSSISMRRFDGMDLTPGQVGATDGIVIECTKREEEDLQGQDPGVYRNRKGFFGFVAMAIVGAYCQFLMFEIQWPGATNDSTAFQQSEAMGWLDFLRGLTRRYWLAGDDAFSSIHSLLLTPFTKKQLRTARSQNTRTYYMMRTFNHVLSSRRITVERAFGILVRRWGCLWSALERRDKDCLLMIIVCVKLHNICVARWRSKNPSSRLPDVPEHIDVPEDLDMDDEEVMERLENQYKDASKKSKQNTLRLQYMDRIFSCGVHFTREDNFLSPFND